MHGHTPNRPLRVKFTDQSGIGLWARAAVLRAAAAGIMLDLPSGACEPFSPASRTDAVAWLGNLVTVTNR